MLAVLKYDIGYQLVYLLHILTFVVAFAPTFLAPRLSRVTAGVDVDARRNVGRAMVDATLKLHLPALILTGFLGIVLILMSDEVYEFSQSWISISFLLWFAMLGVWWFLLLPAQRVLAADRTPEAAKKATMFGGIIHVLLVLMLVVMVFKPGSPFA